MSLIPCSFSFELNLCCVGVSLRYYSLLVSQCCVQLLFFEHEVNGGYGLALQVHSVLHHSLVNVFYSF